MGKEVSLIFKAGQAFGSGAHPSTQGVLQALQALQQSGFAPARVLDMGCGSGILSLTCAALWPEAQVMAADIEEAAVQAVLENAAENGFGERIQVVRADHYGAAEIVAHAPYNLVMANILAEVHVKLAGGLKPVVASDGLVVLSGVLAWLQPQVVAAYEAAGFEVLHELAQADWRLLVMR